MINLFMILIVAAFTTIFIYVESKKDYIMAVVLKGLASLSFLTFGFLESKLCENSTYSKWILIGLGLGMIADILLNLRFVLKKYGTYVFLVGILIFLAGHVMYLIAQLPYISNTLTLLICIGAGVLLTAATLFLIFKIISAKLAFKIFGIFYIGAIMIMSAISICALINNEFGIHYIIFSLGALSFLASDIVLIINTFGSKTTQLLRTINLSLYYLGQVLIGLSLCFVL